MNAIGAYVLQICCCAIISGVVAAIGGNGPGSKMKNMICGLFMTFVIISPLREIELTDLWSMPEGFYQEGQDITASAQKNANEAISDIIIERAGTYILDEANSLNVRLQVEKICLDPDTLSPVQVELSGDIAPYQRSILSDYIADTLGIGKEDQIWSR